MLEVTLFAGEELAVRRAIRARLASAGLRWRRSSTGRPVVAGGELDASWSYTSGAGLLAVADRRIGVDLERVIDRPALRLRLGMSGAEREALSTCRCAGRCYFRAWCAKEAAVKQTGAGLRALGAVRVPLVAAPPACPSLDGQLEAGAQRLAIHELDLGPHLVGVICSHEPVALGGLIYEVAR